MPKPWLTAGPELNSETIASWIGDLQDRLDFLYAWAVQGPPVVVPLGLMARPKTYLTAVLQVRVCEKVWTWAGLLQVYMREGQNSRCCCFLGFWQVPVERCGV